MNKYRVLIADDDELLLKALEFYLHEKDYEITFVKDGENAIKKIRENTYDLIITDINMPICSGLQVISVVRERGLNTPIVVLTAKGFEQTELESFEVGANEFIAKPFSPEVFNIRIERILAEANKP